ncbi:hypothetical protein GCM10009119_34250 [Algoriphagus jejuensis]|uniref:Polysaccharide pyruvyl transferase domain-containing protein n=1 Tax=Algoriphagus jejuensis TaxID=419934 RepID=A0ABP3YJ88_9BACT
MRDILIIGAFDRYNYGDLLFPIILEKQLQSYGLDFRFQFFGLVRSDLRPQGGIPTQGLREFYRQCSDVNHPVHVIIAGGEALGVTWNSLYAALNPLFQKINYRHKKINKILDLNALTKAFLKGKTPLPFLLDKRDFPGIKSVLLNSLGGSGLSAATFAKFPELKPNLQQADYFAVRDEVTLQNVLKAGLKADLFPDSAILMSEFFPVETLEANVSPEVKSYVEKNKGKFAFVQINKKTTRGHETTIAAELDLVYGEGDTKLCFCPIGKALDHDDHEALQNLGKLVKSPFTYFDADTIWDIMYLIANSKCYIGTSLHGAITAMSYAVPHVGLKVEKLSAYLGTWGIESNKDAVEFSGLFERFVTATSVSNDLLEESRDRQFAEIRKAFDMMVEAMTSKKDMD